MAGPLSSVLIRIGADVRGFTNGLGDAQKSLQQFSATLNVTGFRLAALFASTFGAVGGFALKVGKDFEEAFAGVKKTVDPLTTSFPELEKSILATAKATGFSAAQLADLARIGGQLGITGTKNLEKFTDTIAKLSIAAVELTPEAAARGLARLAELSGEGAENIDKLANVLAFLGDKLPTSEERILNFSVLIAGTGKAAGLTGEQILGLSGAFSSVVEGTERASTAVQKFLTEMIKAVEGGGEALDAFGELAGDIGGEKFAKIFREDTGEAIRLVIEGFGNLSDDSSKLIASFEKLGITNIRAFQSFISLANASEIAIKGYKAATEESGRLTKLQEVFAEQLKLVTTQFNRLKQSLEVVGIQLFNAFKDQLQGIIAVGIAFVDNVLAPMVKFIADLPGPVKAAIIAFGGLVAAVSGLLIVFGTIGGALAGVMQLLPAVSAGLGALGLSAQFSATSLALTATGLLQFAGIAAVALTVSKLISDALFDLAINSKDLDPSIRKAAESFGFFERIAESSKIILESITGVLSEFGTAAANAGSVVLDKLGTALTDIFGLSKEAESGIKSLGSTAVSSASNFIPLVLAAKGLFEVQERLRESNARTTESQAKLGAASFISGRKVVDLAEAERILSDQREKLKNNTDLLERAERGRTETVDKAKKSIQEELSAIIQQNEQRNRLKEVTSFLGISEEELALKLKDLGEEFIDAALRAKTLEEQKKKNREEAEKLAQSFRDLSVTAAQTDFSRFSQGIRDAIDDGVVFTKQGAAEIRKELVEKAQLAGMEISTDLKLALGIIPEEAKRAVDEAAKELARFPEAVEGPITELFGTIPSGFDQIFAAPAELIEDQVRGFELLAQASKVAGREINSVAEAEKILGVEGQKTVISIETGTKAIEDNAATTKAWGDRLKDVASDIGAIGTTFKAVGDIIGGEAGKILGSLGDIASGVNTALQGIASGNIFQAAAGIAQGAGQVIGAIKSLFGKPAFKKAMEEVGRDFGVSISEGLGKEIAEAADKLDIGRFEASLLKLSDIIAEAGGVSADNFGMMTDRFNDLLNAVASGAVPIKEGTNAINESFGQLVEGLSELGVQGDVQIAGLIDRMRELGLVSDEVRAFITETASSAVQNLGGFFDFLAEKTSLTREEAEAALPALAGAFNAALQATGSLFGAIQHLPESFGTLLNSLGQVLGTENAVLNELTRYYNFINENEEQLAALDALSQGFGQLVQLGIVNKDTINDFANTFLTQFDGILAKTKDEQTALLAIGPQIGQLKAAFQALGVEVPPDLENLAQKAQEAGASLEPPEGLPDILRDIRDILQEVAAAFGVAAKEANNFSSAASSIGSGGGRPGRPERGQFGLVRTVNEPTTFMAGEAGAETVEITPGGGRGGGGGAGGGMPGTLVLNIDGKTFGKIIGDLSRTGDVRIVPDAVVEFG